MNSVTYGEAHTALIVIIFRQDFIVFKYVEIWVRSIDDGKLYNTQLCSPWILKHYSWTWSVCTNAKSGTYKVHDLQVENPSTFNAIF